MQLFAEWIRQLNDDMKTQGRHILLLLDNFSGHMVDDEEFSHVRIKFLPPNTTSRLQPLDTGIIAVVKKSFRTNRMQKAVELDEMGSENPYKGELRGSMELVETGYQ